jgi:hypothetical protein
MEVQPMSEPHPVGSGHETQDVNLRGLLIITALTIVLGVLVLVGTWWFFQVLRERRKHDVTPANLMALEHGERLPPPPRLEGIERMNGKAKETKSMPSTRPNTYGWVDRKAGIVRVPMDRAITLITEQKLIPSASDRTKQDLDNPYRELPSPANSGRGTPKEQP